MKKSTIQKICMSVLIICFLLLLGTIGANEVGYIGLKQTIIQSVLIIVPMAFATNYLKDYVP